MVPIEQHALSAIAPLEKAVFDLFKRMEVLSQDVFIMKEDCVRLFESLEEFKQEYLEENKLGFPEEELKTLGIYAKKLFAKLNVARFLLTFEPSIRAEAADFYTKDFNQNSVTQQTGRSAKEKGFFERKLIIS